MTEEWRPVLGYEGMYEVSNLGRVRSIPRHYTRSGHPVRVAGKMLQLGTTEHGYRYANLSRGGVGRHALVHRLVLEAFVGPAPADKPECCHNDDDPGNNEVSNLRWGDRLDNMRDMVERGRHHNLRKSHCKNGHPFTDENTRLHDKAKGGRACATCRRDAQVRFYERRRATRAAAGITGPWIGETTKDAIRQGIRDGRRGRELAREFGVAEATVSRLRSEMRQGGEVAA